MSLKLDVDGLIYHNIPLKDVTKVDILNRMYSEPQNKCCDNIIKKDTRKKIYTDNDVHAKIDIKIQMMSKIQVLIIKNGLLCYSLGWSLWASQFWSDFHPIPALYADTT